MLHGKDSTQADCKHFGQQELELDKRDGIITVGLAVFIIALFFLFLRPPYLSDQLDYFYAALNLDEATVNHRHLRVGLIWPTWLVSRLFGYSELSYYSVPLFAALSFGLGTWLLGRVLFGRWVGITAAILILANPWVTPNLTHLLPDYLGAGLFTAGIALIMWLARSGRLNVASFDRLTVSLLLVSGALFGWSYLSREFMAVLFPIVPLVLLAMRARYWSVVPVALGALACWIAELIWGWTKYDAPFVRLLGARPRATDLPFATDPIEILTLLPNLLAKESGGWFFVGLLLVAAAFSLGLTMKGERRWQVIAAWLIGGWLFFTFVALAPPLILGEGRVLLRMHKFRYWAMLLPPLFIGGLAVLRIIAAYLGSRVELRNRIATNIALGCITLGLTVPVWMALQDTWRSAMFRRNGAVDYLEFREQIRKLPSAGKLLVYYGKGGGLSPKRSIPMYLNEWHGLTRVWDGEDVVLDKVLSDDKFKKYENVLIVLDKPDSLTQYSVGMKKFITYVEANGQKNFSSSNNRIQIFNLNMPTLRQFMSSGSEASLL